MKEKEKKNRHEKKNSKMIIIIRIVLLVIFIASVCYLLNYAYKSKENKNLYDDLYKGLITSGNSQDESIYIEKVKELQKENRDIVGWIRIDDTAISYPMLQTTNNDYYLTHNYKKEYTKYGSIFLDSNIDMNNVNSNVIIYRS